MRALKVLLVLVIMSLPMVAKAQPVYEWNDEESTYTDLYRNIKKTEMVEDIDVFSINSLEQQIASIDAQIATLQQRKVDITAEITAAKTAMGIE